ncbi:MAG: FAD-binding oxidoreductase [Cryobacterium sp.]|uniref:FAD-binding oxidoreductase n=1 Tax=unclassified Chelatococcus TaxID=2638111 RepID=UPI001BCB8C3F|nr:MULTISPECIES: FAD-binding oxidoreductase [unclassified Chelatococcus]MBS7701150.1 FAD-binding oxidoreductase [Chelatococcus sp. YT9]MBX3088021.1 FAD-binding oxidoreductase [Cryobacterium sp.]MBX3557281.1 FAD-binding oxidoreductase [Chelatococcus sp.]
MTESAAAAFIADLHAALGPVVITGQDIPAQFHTDWSGLPSVRPIALIRPRETEEVAAALKIAGRHGITIVPQGGLTGLAGGAQPVPGGAVMSLDGMSGIEEIDPVMASMTVKAGTPLEVAQKAAEQAGLFLGLDLGARGSCQIGGNLATNAGGNRVIRYGMAREHVLGLEVVLPDGTVVTSLNKLIKNNAGYDLKQLFIGSEGTLGIITRVVLRLQAKPLTVNTIFCGCRDFPAVLELLRGARARLGPALSAFEVMWPSFYDFMTGKLSELRRPLGRPHGMYVLLEQSGFDPESDRGRLEALMGDMLETGIVGDAVLASSERETRELWAVRDSVSEYSKLMGPLTAFDVGLPASRMAEVVATIEAQYQARWPGAILLVYGHIGDSNLHLVANVPEAGGHQPHDEITDLVLSAVRAVGGTVSAEHGIGLLKKKYLHFTRSEGELALMKRIKAAIDPGDILNTGKVLTL